MRIPVTVFTGFLGAGKTTIIINIIKQMPPSYKLVMLKNEFGNVEVDSKLMQDSNIKVTEMLNGCLCCILVGKLGNALEEIITKYSPDHILIETSGSAYPAPIAWEIDKMKAQLKLDGIITVIDAKNFSGYRDTSYTAKIQAQYTDLILINKHESLSDRELDKVLDDVYELNSSTPKLKTDKGKIPASLIFGLNSKLLNSSKESIPKAMHEHMHKEVEIMELITPKEFSKQDFTKVLEKLPKWDFYRIKGVLKSKTDNYIVNYAFGDFEFIKYPHEVKTTEITFMGKNFEFHYPILLQEFKADKTDLKII